MYLQPLTDLALKKKGDREARSPVHLAEGHCLPLAGSSRPSKCGRNVVITRGAPGCTARHALSASRTRCSTCRANFS